MSNKMLWLGLIVIGVVVALASVLADSLGIGIHPATFGLRQIAGVVAGIAAVVIGVVMYRRAGRAA